MWKSNRSEMEEERKFRFFHLLLFFSSVLRFRAFDARANFYRHFDAQKSLCFMCDVGVRHRRPISALGTPSTWVWWMIRYLYCVYFSNGQKAHTSDVCRLCTRQQMKSTENLCENRSTKVEFSVLFHPFDSGPLWCVCVCEWAQCIYILFSFFLFSIFICSPRKRFNKLCRMSEKKISLNGTVCMQLHMYVSVKHSWTVTYPYNQT